MSQYLGDISAYALAVSHGYTGTEEEYAELMASYATVGQTAVTAAQTATTKASEAATSATTATNKATEATTAATTATTKAGEASTSASTAASAKDTAVSASQTATTKASEATTAAATAVSAKDDAVSANTAAQSAKTAAQTAQTGAETAAASVQSSAAQIQTNADDISQLKSELAVTSSYDITWSQGGINSSGTAVSRTNRIRTDYITIENDSIFVEIPSGFKYAIHAYNSSKTRIGYIPNGSDIMTDRKATYKVSESYANAVYFRMWVAYVDDSNILPTEGDNVTVAPYESVVDTLKSHVLKSVRILGVGNSYTRDSIRWLCKILKESGYEDVIVGHGYLGASTLAEQYASLDSSDSNHSAFEYWKYSNTKNAKKTSGKTLDEIFADEPWDIVVFQQQSDESGQYASYVSSSFDINDFITYISGKVSNTDLKFALMMPWSHADGYTSTKFAEYYNSDPSEMLDAIRTVIPQVADHMSQCDYVVNAGEAIDLGRQNSYLNALGDQMLRTDKNHLYYGIPSYMVGLVYALTLCDVNLNNVMWYPTGTDEGQTGITTSGYLAYLAKQCAFTAVNGYTLAEDVSQLKSEKADVTDLLKAFPTDSAQGAIASFTDGAELPLKSLTVDIEPVQSGSGDPSPDNVRPISGWSEVNVQRTGKNLLSVSPVTQTINGITFTVNDDGTISLSGTATQNTNLFLSSGEHSFLNGSFVLSGCPSGGGVSTYYLRIDNATGGSLVADYGGGKQFTISNGKIYTIYINVKSGVNTNGLVFKPMIELGSTATPYEPYSGQSITIDLGQTVYGGTLDVLSGELVIDMAMADDLGAIDWYKEGPQFYSDVIVRQSGWNYNVLCSAYTQDYRTGDELTTPHIRGMSNGRAYIVNLDYSDVSSFKASLSGVQLCYGLATPITVQLTPHEVTALLGSNNVWADTGDTAVEYRADPTLYIQRLTEPDADMVADANIVSGQYFMVGNTLYKATANIASGATISPNVNCARKSLYEALNELNA